MPLLNDRDVFHMDGTTPNPKSIPLDLEAEMTLPLLPVAADLPQSRPSLGPLSNDHTLAHEIATLRMARIRGRLAFRMPRIEGNHSAFRA